MARYRRFRRVYSRAKRPSDRKVKAGNIVLATPGTTVVGYVFQPTVAGTVKSIRLDIGLTSGGSVPTAYALVVVREGYDANSLIYPAIASDLYNPTMDILISGVLTDNAIEDHKVNMIGRKLKQNDKIALLAMSPTGAGEAAFELSFTFMN